MKSIWHSAYTKFEKHLSTSLRTMAKKKMYIFNCRNIFFQTEKTISEITASEISLTKIMSEFFPTVY